MSLRLLLDECVSADLAWLAAGATENDPHYGVIFLDAAPGAVLNKGAQHQTFSRALQAISELDDFMNNACYVEIDAKGNVTVDVRDFP